MFYWVKEKTPASPIKPVCLPKIFDPRDKAQSSSTNNLNFFAIFKILIISTGTPKKCTTEIAFVFFVILFLIKFKSIFPVSSSQSIKIGFAPTNSIACTVAT